MRGLLQPTIQLPVLRQDPVVAGAPRPAGLIVEGLNLPGELIDALADQAPLSDGGLLRLEAADRANPGCAGLVQGSIERGGPTRSRRSCGQRIVDEG
ncbi:hypothetical protein DQ237_00955 [Blastococcus sp. TF02-8]|nr:hypothetical protein [Blastococcus sp. TF02-8]RBY97550.1 hypothetical protein DQ237_00955 [Blastococcus sp. TF02-8]